MLDRFSRDELVASLLLLHGLHPVDLETRVHRAVEKLVPALQSQGGVIELLRIEAGVVSLRLTRSGRGCSGSTALQQTIRSAFYEAAPDLERLEIDEVSEPAPVAVVPLSSLRRNSVGSIA
jgi:Fe-S cluster biogenesis protein NfuA